MRLEERNLFKMSSYPRNLLGTRKMINSASVTKDAVFNLFLTYCSPRSRLRGIFFKWQGILQLSRKERSLKKSPTVF